MRTVKRFYTGRPNRNSGISHYPDFANDFDDVLHGANGPVVSVLLQLYIYFTETVITIDRVKAGWEANDTAKVIGVDSF